jgi:dihydrofolate reductase
MLDEKPKYVVTSQGNLSSWNSQSIDGKQETLRGLKTQTDDMLLFVASPTLARTLVESALIDGYHVAISPMLAGHGPTFLAGLRNPLNAALLSTDCLHSGVVIHRYGFGR